MKKFLAGLLALSTSLSFVGCIRKATGNNNFNNDNTETGFVSEKVANETAWEKAFDGLHTHFTLDVKMDESYVYDNTTELNNVETVTMTLIVNGDEMSGYAKEFYVYEDGTIVDDYWEEDYLKKVDGNYYQWYRNWSSYGEFTEVGEWEKPSFARDYTNWNDWLPETGMMTTDVFADKYELFIYDETEKVYVYNGNVQTGFSEMAESAFDDTAFCLDDAETLCYKVWIKNGKVAKFYVEMKLLDDYDEIEQATYSSCLYLTYTFGVGEPNLPEFVMPE